MVLEPLVTLQWARVRPITPKWRILGSVVNGRPTKIALRAQQRLIQHLWFCRPHLPWWRSELVTQQERGWAEMAWWESSKEKSTADQKTVAKKHPHHPPILLQKLFYGLTRQKVKTVKTSSIWEKEHHRYSGGAGLMVRGCFAASGPGRLLLMSANTNFSIFTRIFWRGTSGHLFMASSWRALGLCCRTMTRNAPAAPPLNGLLKTK